MTATLESARTAGRQDTRRLSILWYVRYAVAALALGGAWLSEHGASLGLHALRGGLVLGAMTAVVLWRWSRWTGIDAVRPWSALVATEAGIVLAMCGLSPLLSHPHARPDLIVAAIGAVSVAILSPLVHHLAGAPREYRMPADGR